MIDSDLYEDFVKRDKIIKKQNNENKFYNNYNNSNLIKLNGIDPAIKTSETGLGKLTKKMEGFSFKDEKPKKSIINSLLC